MKIKVSHRGAEKMNLRPKTRAAFGFSLMLAKSCAGVGREMASLAFMPEKESGSLRLCASVALR
jgi:hypothetical protein